jgi:hypothetical protein
VDRLLTPRQCVRFWPAAGDRPHTALCRREVRRSLLSVFVLVLLTSLFVAPTPAEDERSVVTLVLPAAVLVLAVPVVVAALASRRSGEYCEVDDEGRPVGPCTTRPAGLDGRGLTHQAFLRTVRRS